MDLPTTPAGRRRFPGMSALAYQHPADLEALESVKKIPLAASIFRKVSDVWLEKWFMLQNIGDNLRLGPKQCPRIYNLVLEAASILDVPVPEVYLDTSTQINAFAFGMKRYTVTLNSALIDLLEEDELLGVIAHELSHIKCDHMLYKSLTEMLGRFGVGALSQVLGVGGNLLSLPLVAALAAWSRRAELSCDRAGVLATQKPESMARALAKLGGMAGSRWRDEIDLEEVVNQASEYEKLDDSIMTKGMLVYLGWQRSHPYPIYRAKQVLDWAAGEQYQGILGGEYVTHEQAARIRNSKKKNSCARCGLTLESTQPVCPGCGAPQKAEKGPPALEATNVMVESVSQEAAPLQARRFCSSCGSECQPKWKFCMGCGAPMAEAGPPAA